MLYHVNQASFALPQQLTDRTMHTFVSFDDEAGEFSVVMSYAPMQPEKTLADFADDLLAGFKKAMPDFSLLGMTERTLDEGPAIELAYTWRNGSKKLHQRQLVALAPGLEQTSRCALMIAASCPPAFADKWRPTFEDLLDSVRLRDRSEAANSVIPVAPLLDASTIFALCAGRRALHAFASQDEACRDTDAYEVQAAAWRFFDATGNALHIRFAGPRAWWRKPGNYVLATLPEPAGPSLRDQLHFADTLICQNPSIGISSIAEVRTRLDALAKG